MEIIIVIWMTLCPKFISQRFVHGGNIGIVCSTAGRLLHNPALHMIAITSRPYRVSKFLYAATTSRPNGSSTLLYRLEWLCQPILPLRQNIWLRSLFFSLDPTSRAPGSPEVSSCIKGSWVQPRPPCIGHWDGNEKSKDGLHGVGRAQHCMRSFGVTLRMIHTYLNGRPRVGERSKLPNQSLTVLRRYIIVNESSQFLRAS